ncbi:MAG: hypothetical protein R6U44_09815 [Archaeoglobaceae archaeon]
MNLILSWKTIFLAVILLTTVQSASAATIHGTIYSWETLEPLSKTELIINTTPEQHMISEDGKYQINLSTGTYNLEAVYYRQGSVEMYAQKNITIEQEGDYKIDLILFPPLSDIGPEVPEDLNFSVDDEEENETKEAVGGVEEESNFNLLIPIVLVVILAAASSAFFIIKKKRFAGEEMSGESSSESWNKSEPYAVKEPETLEKAEEGSVKVDELSELPEDLQKALSIIKKEGGRVTQKDLRKQMGYSEAKMSLVIADLERRSIVEKVKKGRGNIIFLKDGDIH